METKTYHAIGLECKEEGDQGIVQAVFATMDVVDADGDVTLPGAFGSQKVKLGAWGHAWGELPPGKGQISEEGDKAIFAGRFFLDTETGREHFRTIKNLAELQEWSYGFKVLESGQDQVDGRQVRVLKKLRVYEVSPVMVGAGVETQTLLVKGAEFKVWEETENEIRHSVRDSDDFQPDSFRRVTIKRDKPRVFAIMGRLKGETTMTIQALRFPKDDGWTVADAKKWVADHPDIAKSYDIEGLTLAEEMAWAETSLADVRALVEHSQALAGLRAKEGRTLSAANRGRLQSLMEAMESAITDIEKLLTETEPPEKALQAALLRESLRYQRLRAEATRLLIPV